MSESPLEPLPPDLAKLFEREARSYADDPAAKQRVLQGVSSSVLFSLPGSAPHAPIEGGAGHGAVAAIRAWTGAKVLAIAGAAFVVGGASGAVVGRQWLPPREGPAPIVVAPPTVSPPAPTLASNAPDDSAPAPASPSTSSSAAPVRPTTSASAGSTERTGTLEREREVLDAARAALSHGRWSEALAAVHEHETRWPHGALEEEREVLAIRALAGSGQTAAACARAARFRQRFPASMLGDVVSSALAQAGCAEGTNK